MPVKIIECPRDAMQGLHDFIPTNKKIQYINQLLKVGFDTIDFGSFVSPKAIPQMQDTTEVLNSLDMSETKSKLLAIIANTRGAETAASFPEISYLGFPFSISETFQKRNTNSSIAESLITVEQIQEICLRSGKQLVVYISMGFGNPYGDPWSTEVAEKWIAEMDKLGIKIISLSDTIGIANPETISYFFGNLIPAFPHIEFGAHLHTTPYTWHEKLEAAFNGGCKRFDGTLKGYGGCPMAADKLTGNMATENLLAYFSQNNEQTNIKVENFNTSMLIANQLFSKYH
jgi:hydroxymethylglutaryl-CoA lyase